MYVHTLTAQQVYIDKIYLSELNLDAVDDAFVKPRADSSVTGRPVLIGARRYRKGIGVHANTTILIDLGKNALRFTAYVGVDAMKKGYPDAKVIVLDSLPEGNVYCLSEDSSFVGVGPSPRKICAGSIIFEVWADGQLAFQSEVMKGGEPPRKIDLNLRGIRYLELNTFDAGDGICGDHGDWGDARILYRGVVPEIISDPERR